MCCFVHFLFYLRPAFHAVQHNYDKPKILEAYMQNFVPEFSYSFFSYLLVLTIACEISAEYNDAVTQGEAERQREARDHRQGGRRFQEGEDAVLIPQIHLSQHSFPTIPYLLFLFFPFDRSILLMSLSFLFSFVFRITVQRNAER